MTQLQLIDDGVGYALKNEMGKRLDDWLALPGHLEMWTAEGNAFPMWKKRVLVTELAACAWENICSRFDFERAATRLGMRMTVDGSGDSLIRIQGLENYSFSDADGGDAGAESEDEGDILEEEEASEQDVEEDADAGEHDDDATGEDFEEVEGDGDNDNSEDDDTAEPGTVATYVGEAEAPTGYVIVQDCPQLESEADLQALIGQVVYVGHDTDQAQGWFVGHVAHRNLSATDLRNAPTANFVVKYKASETDRMLNGSEARELSARLYGKANWWVCLRKA
ncbi:hypothetical protein AB1Y20_013798 [Prymnesium parvum]|uniref:Uncharacterized protein n=1 Tax=Prymnesium parvum TaxID=97485 RepID=A0AB34IFG0_PRYPA